MLKRVIVAAGAGVLGVGLFLLGVGIGSGQISFGSPANSENASLPEDLDYSSVERLYDALRANYDGKLDVDALLNGIKHGLAEATGDPYTVYLDSEEAEEFKDQLNGTFSGIGAEIGLNDNDELIVVAPIEGFPAAKAGLRPQDVIVSIDGKSAVGLSITEAVNKIRGPKGTEVELEIVRGESENLTFKIIREDIKIPSVETEVLEGNVGYLRISQFGDDTAQLAASAAREFKDRGVNGVILDLRGNPGGVLNGAIDVASLWLPKGTTVLEQRRGDTTISTETATGNDILRGVSTVVLVNEGSASASEIVAGALKDNKAATVMGTKSYGKGSVQEIHPLRGGAELKVTIARWYRPSGENIDEKGITPGTVIEMTEEDYKQDRDPQRDGALEFLRK